MNKEKETLKTGFGSSTSQIMANLKHAAAFAIRIDSGIRHPKGECGSIDCACYVDPLRKMGRIRLEEMK